MEEKPERPDYEAQIAADVKSIRSAVNFFVCAGNYRLSHTSL